MTRHLLTTNPCPLLRTAPHPTKKPTPNRGGFRFEGKQSDYLAAGAGAGIGAAAGAPTGAGTMGPGPPAQPPQEAWPQPWSQPHLLLRWKRPPKWLLWQLSSHTGT